MRDVRIALPLTLRSHRAQVCVAPDVDGGWDVVTELDGRQLASDYCGNWHRVEHYRANMQRWLAAVEDADVPEGHTFTVD